jgi:hypothetical protein
MQEIRVSFWEEYTGQRLLLQYLSGSQPHKPAMTIGCATLNRTCLCELAACT